MKSIFLKIFILGLLVTCCFSGCEPNKKDVENDARKNNKSTDENLLPSSPKKKLPVFKQTTFSSKESNCEVNCSYITVNYPTFNDPNASELNQAIKDQIRHQLSDFVLEGNPSQTLQELSNTFNAGFHSFKTAFPEASTPWYVEIEVAINYMHPDFISLSQVTSSFTGGAHTNTISQFQNIKYSGEPITDLSFFITDVKRLKEIAEETFRKQNRIKGDESLSDYGYTFENDHFDLTENFGFTDSGLVFYYNSYEIAPYVNGPSVIAIPFDAIREIYRFEQIQS